MCVIRDADAAWLRDALKAGGDVDAIAENIIVVDDDVADMNANAKFDPAVQGHVGILRSHIALNLDRASRCVHRTGEFNQYAIPRCLDNSASMLDDLGIEKSLSESLQLAERALFIGAHEPTITGDIRRQYSRQSPFHPLVGQGRPIGISVQAIKACPAAPGLGPMSQLRHFHLDAGNLNVCFSLEVRH